MHVVVCIRWNTVRPAGQSIDFEGPNYNEPPYTFTVDLGQAYTFTHWRVAGDSHYSFGDASLKYSDASGTMTDISGSSLDYTNRAADGFAYATFDAPVIATTWQVYISSTAYTSSYGRRVISATSRSCNSSADSFPPSPSPLPAPPPSPPPSPSPKSHRRPNHRCRCRRILRQCRHGCRRRRHCPQNLLIRHHRRFHRPHPTFITAAEPVTAELRVAAGAHRALAALRGDERRDVSRNDHWLQNDDPCGTCSLRPWYGVT